MVPPQYEPLERDTEPGSTKFVRHFGQLVTRGSLSPLRTQSIHKPAQDYMVIDTARGIVERGTRKVAR